MSKPTLIASLRILMESYRSDRDAAPDPQTKQRLNGYVLGCRNDLRSLGAVA